MSVTVGSNEKAILCKQTITDARRGLRLRAERLFKGGFRLTFSKNVHFPGCYNWIFATKEHKRVGHVAVLVGYDLIDAISELKTKWLGNAVETL